MAAALAVQKTKGIGWKMPFSDSELQVLARAMLDAAGFSGFHAELSILDDAAMAVLHEQAFGCAGPTNILSFSAREGGGPVAGHSGSVHEGEMEGEDCFLGWLALSADTLLRESFLYGQSLERHCIRLLAHGLAHLAGYDHGPEMDSLCECMESAGVRVMSLA